MNIIRRLWTRCLLRRRAVPARLWRDVSRQMPILTGMTAVEKARLRILTTLFLRQKRFVGARGFALTDAMGLSIAIQACLPVLRLGLDSLSDWSEIIVYPDAFRIDRDETDDAGVVHRHKQALLGEAWERGPLILSWAEAAKDGLDPVIGRNVVIHEIAHKLDMLNGPADGFPPLPARMDAAGWSEAFSAAYDHLLTRLELGRRSCIDSYAAESPAEFFAVVSEYFFAAPAVLHECYPEVYRQLALYYRQDTLQRRSA